MRIVIETDDPVRVQTPAEAATRSTAVSEAVGDALSGGAAPAELSAEPAAERLDAVVQVAEAGGVVRAADAHDGGPAPAANDR